MKMSNNEWFKRGELPPVGTECEISNCGDEWEKVKILFMGKTICIADWSYKQEQHFHLSSVKFRPLRTEREPAIDEIKSIIVSLGYGSAAGEIATKIYDAGFRKTEV